MPGYHLLNHSFPPQNVNNDNIPMGRVNPPLIEKWKWKEGRWWAVIPDVGTQERKGWYSRPVSARRRAARPSRADN